MTEFKQHAIRTQARLLLDLALYSALKDTRKAMKFAHDATTLAASLPYEGGEGLNKALHTECWTLCRTLVNLGARHPALGL